MKGLSAARAKRGESSSHLYPQPGTKLRETFERFHTHKGEAIDFCTSSAAGRSQHLLQLQDFYGLDIRRVGKNRWLLAGEWFGPTYVDYVADRFHAGERAA